MGLVHPARIKMDYPGIDVKKMTDDELLKRVSDLHGKMLYAHAFSTSSELVQQMQAILETLEAEQFDRAQRRAFELEQKRTPKVIETEPDLVEKKEVVTTTKTKIRTGVAGGGLMKRSRTPASDQP